MELMLEPVSQAVKWSTLNVEFILPTAEAVG